MTDPKPMSAYDALREMDDPMVPCPSWGDRTRWHDAISIELAAYRAVSDAVGKLSLNDVFIHSGGEPFAELFDRYAAVVAMETRAAERGEKT